jgi:hypothetical protein
MNKERKCSICGDPCGRFGNNAMPFAGRACNDCNDRFVVPARILHITDPVSLQILARVAKLGRTLVLASNKVNQLMAETKGETS